jgi:hypothetical protein
MCGGPGGDAKEDDNAGVPEACYACRDLSVVEYKVVQSRLEDLLAHAAKASRRVVHPDYLLRAEYFGRVVVPLGVYLTLLKGVHLGTRASGTILERVSMLFKTYEEYGAREGSCNLTAVRMGQLSDGNHGGATIRADAHFQTWRIAVETMMDVFPNCDVRCDESQESRERRAKIIDRLMRMGDRDVPRTDFEAPLEYSGASREAVGRAHDVAGAFSRFSPAYLRDVAE